MALVAAAVASLSLVGLVAESAGAKVTSGTTGSISSALPNPGVARFVLGVGQKGKVTDVNVSVRIGHTHDPDLSIVLRAPSGRYVNLATNLGTPGAGSGNDNYGGAAASCSGQQTTFDDQAATAITSAVPPFAGAFRPEQPLSSLNGSQVRGNWELYVIDSEAVSVNGATPGALYCASLRIAYKPAKKK